MLESLLDIRVAPGLDYRPQEYTLSTHFQDKDGSTLKTQSSNGPHSGGSHPQMVEDADLTRQAPSSTGETALPVAESTAFQTPASIWSHLNFPMFPASMKIQTSTSETTQRTNSCICSTDTTEPKDLFSAGKQQPETLAAAVACVLRGLYHFLE